MSIMPFTSAILLASTTWSRIWFDNDCLCLSLVGRFQPWSTSCKVLTGMSKHQNDGMNTIIYTTTTTTTRIRTWPTKSQDLVPRADEVATTYKLDRMFTTCRLTKSLREVIDRWSSSFPAEPSFLCNIKDGPSPPFILSNLPTHLHLSVAVLD